MSNYLPQVGDIGLVSIAGDVGKLIRFGQWLDGDGYTTYEHAFVVVDDVDSNGTPVIVEAEPGASGARYVPLHYSNVYWCQGIGHNLTDAQRQAIADAAVNFIHVKYSFLDYFALAAHRLHVPVPGLKKYIGDSGHEICSQLVDSAYAIAGVQIFDDGRWPGYVTPGMLYQQDLLMRAKYSIGA